MEKLIRGIKFEIESLESRLNNYADGSKEQSYMHGQIMSYKNVVLRLEKLK